MKSEAAGRTRAGALRRLAVAVLLAALFVLHQDAWFWRDARPLLGLPVGLTYHVLYCLAATCVLALAVRWSWPREVSPADSEERD